VFAFTKFSLARQFLVISLVILVTGMLVIGAWVSQQIEQSVLNRTAAITALYVDSFVSPHLQSLQDGDRLSPNELADLGRLLAETSLGQQIVSFKIWSSEGQVLYNPAPDQIDRQYGIGDALAEAFSGNVNASLSDLEDPENEYERQYWDRLIETYAPVRATGSDEIIAVSEFYQLPDDLAAEIQTAQMGSWLVVGVATLAMYLLLASLVSRASKTILSQQEALEEQLAQVRDLLTKNRRLHNRVRRAAGRTTTLNERFLRRISADLHDGPGQDLALALMRIEPMAEFCANCAVNVPDLETQLDNLQIINNAVTSALKELRIISVGLRLPELTHLSPEEVAQRAVRDYQRKTGQTVALKVDGMPAEISVQVKITLYRVLQESLMNGFAHAGGANQSVYVRQVNGSLVAEVSDNGKGFDLQMAGQDGHLGLAGMRERVELLGGTFILETAPGQGARVCVTIPLEQSPEDPNTDEHIESWV
jgi:signal transduction histidine kinase